MDEWNKLTTEYLFLSASSSCLYPYAVTLVAVCLILYNKSTGVIWILCHPDDVIFHDNEFHIAQHIIEPLKFSHLLRGPWGRHSALSFYFCLLLSSYNPNTSKLALKLKTLHLTGKKKKKQKHEWITVPKLVWNCVTFVLRQCQQWQFITGTEISD